MGYVLPQNRRVLRPIPRRLTRPTPRNRSFNWQMIAPKAWILEEGDPFFDESTYFRRKTPTGLTEQELLSTLNYMDEEGLQKFNGIGPSIALNIINWRSAHEYFKSLDQLVLIPRIGPQKFVDLAGRSNDLERFPLHDLLRISRRETIQVEHLQPWRNPAPAYTSVFYEPADQEDRHFIQCARHNLDLVVRKVLDRRLYFYQKPNQGDRRSNWLLRELPLILRRIRKKELSNGFFHERN